MYDIMYEEEKWTLKVEMKKVLLGMVLVYVRGET